jgi:hypothetical protein
MAAGRIAAVTLVLALAGSAQAESLPEIRPPDWGGLNPRQKQVLTPLHSEWDSLPDARRKNWLGIANSYPHMSIEEQRRVQARIKEWAELTPDQRRKARERYRSLQNVPPKQREALKQKWEEQANSADRDTRTPVEISPFSAPNPAPQSSGRAGRSERAAGIVPGESTPPKQPPDSASAQTGNASASKSGPSASQLLPDQQIEEKAPAKTR